MTLRIFCHCVFTSRVFIVIPKGTLNFSLWKCIVCWIVASVPRGVENNTPSQHWEKYYCQIFYPCSFCITVKPRRHNVTFCHMLQAHVWSSLCAKRVAESVDRWEEISAWIELQKDETGRWGEKHKRLPMSLCLWIGMLAASALKHCMRSLSFPRLLPYAYCEAESLNSIFSACCRSCATCWGRKLRLDFQRGAVTPSCKQIKMGYEQSYMCGVQSKHFACCLLSFKH